MKKDILYEQRELYTNIMQNRLENKKFSQQ